MNANYLNGCEPSYADVVQENNIPYQTMYQAIATGMNDADITYATFRSHRIISKYRRYYKAHTVTQLNKVVLKDGTVIPLTEEQSVKLAAFFMITKDTSRAIRFGNYRFRVKDICTDKAEIERLAQTTLDIGSFPQIPDGNKRKRKKVQELS